MFINCAASTCSGHFRPVTRLGQVHEIKQILHSLELAMVFINFNCNSLHVKPLTCSRIGACRNSLINGVLQAKWGLNGNKKNGTRDFFTIVLLVRVWYRMVEVGSFGSQSGKCSAPYFRFCVQLYCDGPGKLILLCPRWSFVTASNLNMVGLNIFRPLS